MKCIILNSGMGTRLGNLTHNSPKSLVKLNGNESIFSRTIKILTKFEIDEFIITTDYMDNVLKDYAKSNFSNLDFTFIHNPAYDKTNYTKSIDLIPEIDDDIILLHRDLVFINITANKIIINAKNNSVIINSTVPLPKNDFKAKIVKNKITYISTKYFNIYAVSYQPFYKITSKDWKLWKNKIRKFCKNNKNDVYAENALNQLTDRIHITPIDIKGEYA